MLSLLKDCIIDKNNFKCVKNKQKFGAIMSVVDVWPEGSMALLTQSEADALSLSSSG